MTPREDLRERALAYVAEHGIGELSLRQLAAAIGTSHRMLIHHFGSKGGLLVELVRAVERAQQDALAELFATADLSPEERARHMWERLTDPALGPFERLFFELYGQALQGRPHATALLDGVVDTWVEPVAEFNRRAGLERPEAWSRLGLAVTRGLLLDLLATGERERVDEAMELFIAVYGERLP